MQLVGLALLSIVIWFGFAERPDATVSAIDPHAMVMVLGGSLAAVLIASTARTSLRTFTALREIVPGAGTLGQETASIEAERQQLTELWRQGKRAQAVELAQRSSHPAITRMLELVLDRAPSQATEAAFTELNHNEMLRWQPAIANWELLSKLAPSFGMIGTITGMIQMFKNLGDDTDMGSAISLALLATLYGVAFGAGVAGPISHYLRTLLDEQMGVLERCEQSVHELFARAGRGTSSTGV